MDRRINMIVYQNKHDAREHHKALLSDKDFTVFSVDKRPLGCIRGYWDVSGSQEKYSYWQVSGYWDAVKMQGLVFKSVTYLHGHYCHASINFIESRIRRTA